MFYYDSVLKSYEDKYNWKKCLEYLDLLFRREENVQIVITAIGFAWYYFISGAAESKTYDLKDSYIGLEYWKKYLNIGFNKFSNSSYFCFIAGYTLALHGFFISDESNINQEEKGYSLIKKCEQTSKNAILKNISACFLERRNSKKIIDSNLTEVQLKALFNTDSLLDRYFINIFST